MATVQATVRYDAALTAARDSGWQSSRQAEASAQAAMVTAWAATDGVALPAVQERAAARKTATPAAQQRAAEAVANYQRQATPLDWQE